MVSCCIELIQTSPYRFCAHCAMTGYFHRPNDRTQTRERQHGFSLIEIMVVVVIMGVLAALVVPKVMDRPDQARVIAAKQDIGAIMQALKLYRLDHGRYPTSAEGLGAFVTEQGKGARYLERLPNDPWNTPYQYLNPGVHGEIDVFSLGADGKPGGEGIDADIGSWTR